jgi:hypothetical protein
MTTDANIAERNRIMRTVFGEPDGSQPNIQRLLEDVVDDAVEKSPSARCNLMVAQAALSNELDELAHTDTLVRRLLTIWDSEPPKA